MKTKRFMILLCTLCFLCMIPMLPAAAKSKPSPKKLILSRNEIVLYPGESKKLIVEKTKPAYASSKVTWISKNKRIAVVSKRGKIIAKKPGKTIITASSKKNPSVKATVRVIVKKTPEKAEKTCDASGNGYSPSEFVYTLVNFYCDTYSCPSYLGYNGIIVRSREGFNELKKVWKTGKKKSGYYTAPFTPFRETLLAEYKDMDFSKESLVILRTPAIPSIHNYPVISLTTKFDEAGNLEGIVDMRDTSPYYPYNPNDAITFQMSDTLIYEPPTSYSCAVVLRIKKSDEAMIDSYRVWGETYDKIIIAP